MELIARVMVGTSHKALTNFEDSPDLKRFGMFSRMPITLTIIPVRESSDISLIFIRGNVQYCKRHVFRLLVAVQGQCGLLCQVITIGSCI